MLAPSKMYSGMFYALIGAGSEDRFCRDFCYAFIVTGQMLCPRYRLRTGYKITDEIIALNEAKNKWFGKLHSRTISYNKTWF